MIPALLLAAAVATAIPVPIPEAEAHVLVEQQQRVEWAQEHLRAEQATMDALKEHVARQVKLDEATHTTDLQRTQQGIAFSVRPTPTPTPEATK